MIFDLELAPCILCYRTTAMAKDEGVRRVVMTGKLIVLIGVTAGVFPTLVMMSGLVEKLLNPAILIGAFAGLRVAAFGGLVWAAGCIAEGFILSDD